MSHEPNVGASSMNPSFDPVMPVGAAPGEMPDCDGGHTHAPASALMRRLPAEAPSFDQVFEEHAPYVWRVLRRFGVRHADLKDVCQEVFIVVHGKLGTY